jgi:hypothetical protein
MVMFSVYKEPTVIKQMISHEMCDTILNSTSEFKPSTMGGSIYDKNFRYSYTATLENESVVNILAQKCLDVLNFDEVYIEPPLVVHYKVGGFYKTHDDSCEQYHRPFTILLSLNDEYEGGETEFPNLDKKFKLNKGDALVFNNFNTDGTYTKLSRHNGQIVKSGEKWVCNLWVHKYSYNN